MSTLVILLSAIFVLTLVGLWGFLAMASWSDGQIMQAWQEWQEAKADADATAA